MFLKFQKKYAPNIKSYHSAKQLPLQIDSILENEMISNNDITFYNINIQ